MCWEVSMCTGNKGSAFKRFHLSGDHTPLILRLQEQSDLLTRSSTRDESMPLTFLASQAVSSAVFVSCKASPPYG